MTPRVGFVGLGRMGGPITGHLRAAGYALTVNDVEPERARSIVAQGAEFAPDLGTLARASDVVLTCVPGPADVQAVFFASDGLLAAAAPGTVFIEMSTIDVALSRRVAAACDAAGMRYLDAPISGGSDGAHAGTLCVMVGGDAAVLGEVEDVLRSFSDRIVHVGPSGAGHFTKLLNQMVFLGYVALFCEATALADAFGTQRAPVIDVLRNSVAGHPLEIGWERRLLDGDRTGGFTVARVLKDLHAADAARSEVRYDAPVFAAALAAFERAAENGYAHEDMTALGSLRGRTG